MATQGWWGFDDTVGIEPGASSASNTGGRTGGGGVFGPTITVPTPGPSLIHGFAIRANSTSPGAGVFWQAKEGSTVHLQLAFTTDPGTVPGTTIQLKNSAGTVLATTSILFDGALWTYFEVKFTINDTTGSFELRINEAVAASVSGIDTKNGGTGNVDTFICTSPISANRVFYDDMYIGDTYLGDIVVRTLLPNGDGDSSQWTGSDGNSTNNSLLVDEANSSATDYVLASTAGLTDLYALGDVPTTDAVYGYRQLTYAGKSDGGTPPVLKPVTKGQSGTVREEAGLTLSTTYATYASAWRTTDPDGNALTPARINAMQVGVRSA
jgi:hypothetical protein